MFRVIKAMILWGYARNTWQYDVLCALILAFIFLTPKSWFENGELPRFQRHQTLSVSPRMLVSTELITPNMSRDDVEKRMRELTGQPDLTVADVRAKQDAQGKTLVYEVDIR